MLKSETSNTERAKLSDLPVFMCVVLIFSPPFSASAAQRSSVTRPKDSAFPLQARDSTAASMEDFTCKDQTVCSYQQISCLDSVIRSGLDLVVEISVIIVQMQTDCALFAQ